MLAKLVELILFHEHWVIEGEMLLCGAFNQAWHLQGPTHVWIAVEVLIVSLIILVDFVLLHHLLDLVVVIHLLFYRLCHERSDHVLELRQFRLNTPDRHKRLVLAYVMQLFVGLLVVVVYVWRALVPFVQVALEPLMLFALDRVFQLPHLLLRAVCGVVDLVDVVFEALNWKGLLGKALGRARRAQELGVLEIR